MEDAKTLRYEVIPSGEEGVNLPVNLKRLIWNAQQLFKIKPHKKVASGDAPAMVCCYLCGNSNVWHPASCCPASCGRSRIP